MKVDITVVLDRSGSMQEVADDVIGGFNKLIDDQKKLDKNKVDDCVFTLVQFDTEYEFVYKGVPIQDVKELDFKPRGMTALLDAVGKAMAETAERVETIADKPKVVFVIMTDGHENASKEFKLQPLKQLIEQRQKDGWEFIFQGADMDAFGEGSNLGITHANIANMTKAPGSYQTMYGGTSSTLSVLRSMDTKTTTTWKEAEDLSKESRKT